MTGKQPPCEAEEVPGPIWSGPQRTVAYPHAGEPLIRVYADGAWRSATVTSRHTYPDGRVSISCSIRMPDGDYGMGTYARTYWWSPDRMRVIWDGRSA